MQQFRKIASLQEDLQALGLAKPSPRENRYGGFASEKPALYQEAKPAPKKKSLSESRKELARRKQKANRSGRLEQRLGRAPVRTESKSRVKASRRQKLKKVLGESFQAYESLRGLNMEVSGNVYKTLGQGFVNVGLLAKTLGRKFAIAEDVMAQAELEMGAEGLNKEPVLQNPEQPPYGYVNPEDNIVGDGKVGDATDDVSDAPVGNEDDEDTNPDHPMPLGNEEPVEESRRRARMEAKKKKRKSRKEDVLVVDADAEEFMDDEGEDEEAWKDYEGNREVHEQDDEDEEDKKDKKDVQERVDMSDEMFNLRLEAEDIMAQLKTHVISPEEAGNILKDMVQYLGGAMTMYMDLAQSIGKYAYAGIGAPEPTPESVPSNGKKNKYVGDALDTESPEV